MYIVDFTKVNWKYRGEVGTVLCRAFVFKGKKCSNTFFNEVGTHRCISSYFFIGYIVFSIRNKYS
ncbi:hypothetical protein, partial [Acidiplasma cupricumulans]|uniref:hypothetical protein n=1 Tax=Acidiplasma cupricumulans TaxID=312540 RepID=UPI000ABD1F75